MGYLERTYYKHSGIIYIPPLTQEQLVRLQGITSAIPRIDGGTSRLGTVAGGGPQIHGNRRLAIQHGDGGQADRCQAQKGCGGLHQNTNSGRVFDPRTNEWSVSRSTHAATAVGGLGAPHRNPARVPEHSAWSNSDEPDARRADDAEVGRSVR
jgi:hypothetical protein